MDSTGVAVWIMWVLANFVSIATIVLSVVTLFVAVCELIDWIVRCRRAELEEALLLESVPGVPYQPPPLLLPGAGAGVAADVVVDDDGREACVICVTPYEAGDPCSVLPACGHRFHTHCVLQWLRTKRTCPLCGAALTTVTAARPPDAQPHGYLNAAELMV